MDLGYAIVKRLIGSRYGVEITAISSDRKSEWELRYPRDERDIKKIKRFLNEFLSLRISKIEKVWVYASKPNSFLTFEVRKKKGLDCVRVYEYENCEDILRFIEERYWVENPETF